MMTIGIIQYMLKLVENHEWKTKDQIGATKMLVRERMSYPVITIHPELPIQEALFRMRQENVRRFPVVDKRGHLVGIVSEKDLLNINF
jgi:CBS domain-containing protein